jgi:hypothetical protein
MAVALPTVIVLVAVVVVKVDDFVKPTAAAWLLL